MWKISSPAFQNIHKLCSKYSLQNKRDDFIQATRVNQREIDTRDQSNIREQRYFVIYLDIMDAAVLKKTVLNDVYNLAFFSQAFTSIITY